MSLVVGRAARESAAVFVDFMAQQGPSPSGVEVAADKAIGFLVSRCRQTCWTRLPSCCTRSLYTGAWATRPRFPSRAARPEPLVLQGTETGRQVLVESVSALVASAVSVYVDKTAAAPVLEKLVELTLTRTDTRRALEEVGACLLLLPCRRGHEAGGDLRRSN